MNERWCSSHAYCVHATNTALGWLLRLVMSSVDLSGQCNYKIGQIFTGLPMQTDTKPIVGRFFGDLITSQEIGIGQQPEEYAWPNNVRDNECDVKNVKYSKNVTSARIHRQNIIDQQRIICPRNSNSLPRALLMKNCCLCFALFCFVSILCSYYKREHLSSSSNALYPSAQNP